MDLISYDVGVNEEKLKFEADRSCKDRDTVLLHKNLNQQSRRGSRCRRMRDWDSYPYTLYIQAKNQSSRAFCLLQDFFVFKSYL